MIYWTDASEGTRKTQIKVLTHCLVDRSENIYGKTVVDIVCDLAVSIFNDGFTIFMPSASSDSDVSVLSRGNGIGIGITNPGVWPAFSDSFFRQLAEAITVYLVRGSLIEQCVMSYARGSGLLQKGGGIGPLLSLILLSNLPFLDVHPFLWNFTTVSPIQRLSAHPCHRVWHEMKTT